MASQTSSCPGLLGVFIGLAARAEEPAELVRIQSGDLPIILSAPHGGQLDVPEVDVRNITLRHRLEQAIEHRCIPCVSHGIILVQASCVENHRVATSSLESGRR